VGSATSRSERNQVAWVTLRAEVFGRVPC